MIVDIKEDQEIIGFFSF